MIWAVSTASMNLQPPLVTLPSVLIVYSFDPKVFNPSVVLISFDLRVNNSSHSYAWFNR
ncbi:MAG: hypothetical protein ACTS6G_02880 [Candidatus Hodgkinia cicadicola]